MQTISCYNNASKPKFLTRITSNVPFLPILLRIFYLLCGINQNHQLPSYQLLKSYCFFTLVILILSIVKEFELSQYSQPETFISCQHCQIDLLPIAQNSMNIEAVFWKTIKQRSRKFIEKALGCPILCAIGIGVMHSIKKCNEQD